MSGDKILICCVASNKDIGCLSAMLQTLIVCPPVIPWRVVVIGERGQSGDIAMYCSQSEGVGFVESADDIGSVLDGVASAEDNLRLLVHCDVLFINKLWSEAIFSKMIDVGAAMVGATPFCDMHVGEGKYPSFSPWFVAWSHNLVQRAGGFSGTTLGRGSWMAAYLRCRQAGMLCVGADIGGLVVHLDVDQDDSLTANANALDKIMNQKGIAP